MRLPAICCACLLLTASSLAHAQPGFPPVSGQLSEPAAPTLQSLHQFLPPPPVPLIVLPHHVKVSNPFQFIPRITHSHADGAIVYIDSPVIGKTEHLKKAAEHLEAAGLKEEAKRIRAQAATIVHQQLLGQKLQELQKLHREISRLRLLVGTPQVQQSQQVQVDVKIIDVALDKLRDLGITLSEFQGSRCCQAKTAGNDVVIPDYVDPTGAKNEDKACPHTCAAAHKIIDEQGNITKFGRALQKKGILKIVSEPTIVALPGRSAAFRSGGEFPVIVASGEETKTIEWRDFGVVIETVPTIMPDGRIRLELSVETSRRDFSNAVESNGIKVPGLNIRRVNTQVVAKPGQTVVVGGMISATRKTDADNKISQTETGTIVVVTPTLINGKSAIQPASHEVHPHPHPHGPSQTSPQLLVPPVPDGRILFGPVR